MDGQTLRLVPPPPDGAPLPPPCAGGRTWTVSVYPPLREGGPWFAYAVEVAHDQADDVLAVGTGASGESSTGYTAAMDALASAMPEPNERRSA